MLEAVDLKSKLGKQESKATLDALDLRLGALQRDLKAAKVPVLVVLEGWDTAGKGSLLGRLLKPLDPRGYKVHFVGPPNEEEKMFPPMQRYWKMTPGHGEIAIFSHSWYREILDAALDKKGEQAVYERIRVFERQLADDGVIILKFFLHISKKEQAKRFKQLSKDPAFAWKISKAAKKRHKKYSDHYETVEDMLRETSTPFAPWSVVPCTDDRFRNVMVAETLVAAFESHLSVEKAPAAQAPDNRPRRTSPLDRAKLDSRVEPEAYSGRLSELQEEVRRLQHLCYIRRAPVIMVFEGWDAAGKGGNIRRLVRELDPRGYEVIPVAAPEGAEKTHHYLWRFWRALPKAGHFAIFDRSWYGRLLVERVEGFAQPSEWGRAYREINEFEGELAADGAIIFKFWVHISKEEQLSRFEARQQDEHKQWKITDEDWRNREQWDEYHDAISDMIEWTSTLHAPWTIVEGNDKRFARLKVLQTVADGLKHLDS